jgi:putative ABC transport system permease protein
MNDATVLFLVMAESIVVAAIGGVAGLALAKLFTLRGDPTGGMLPNFYLAGRSLGLGFVLALAAGAAAGIIPAMGAMRLKIVDALRRV